MTSFRKHISLWLGLLAGLIGTIVYALTAEPSVSWWDCGEFLATSRYLQVGHPPGAPVYSLLEHLFMLLAGGDVTRMAFCGNLLSAVAGGATGAFLFWTIVRLAERIRKNPIVPAAAAKRTKKGKQRFAKATPAAPAASPCAETAADALSARSACPDADAGATAIAAPAAAADIPAFSSLLAGGVGALAYLFCDTAWFSAVESEVYSLSMLFSAVIFWAGLRWMDCADARRAPRWLLLIALLLGLSVGVHLLSLLTLPALLLMYLFHRRRTGWRAARLLPTLPLAALLFLLGLSPLLTIPIRASAGTPINEGDPSSAAAFRDYMGRKQYSHAPLYPRIWRVRSDDDYLSYQAWCGDPRQPKLKDNVQLFMGYQLEYMYLRYLMWNFSGRFNDRQGFCTLQNGQFITGFPPVDRLLVGTGAKPPASMPMAGHNVYFMLPLLLALLGLFFHARRHKKDFWTVFALFLVSGVGLAVYLNHPVYEPRERDYAYVLSFYAFAIWIGLGAQRIDLWLQRRTRGQWHKAALLTMAVPLLMAFQNLDDHDRASRHTPRDVAFNYLNECPPHAILLTFGDNDTFPFWYLQQVEGQRTDVQVINLNLFATDWYQRQTAAQLAQQGSALLPLEPPQGSSFVDMLVLLLQNDRVADSAAAGDTAAHCRLRRPLQMSHYAKERYGPLFDGYLQLTGFSYALQSERCDTVALERCYRNVMRSQWHSLEGAYIDEVSQRMLKTYWNHVLTLVQNLLDRGENAKAAAVLDKTCRDIPCRHLDDLRIAYAAAGAYRAAGATAQYHELMTLVRATLHEQLAYYATLSPHTRSFIPYTLQPLLQVQQALQDEEQR